ncbi:MAG: ribosome small subunit-dependent GTPase A [Velocimicrobium sp.]
MNTLKEYGLNECFLNEASLYPKLKLARVITQFKGLYKIATENRECFAEVSGKFRHDTTVVSLFPAVGDYVMVSHSEDQGHAMIQNVLTRKSSFERTAVGVTGQSQVIATNVDVVFLCMSLNNNYNLSRLERYLSIAWNSGSTPVIILTKSDLCDDLQKKIQEVEGIAAYSNIIVTSVFDNAVDEKIFSYLKPGITASFIGSSGVGKSTLINKLMGIDALATAKIGKNDKGRHTTTGREMRILPNGGIVIDTPGMREIGVESADLSKSFAEIEELEAKCKFRNCTHTSEPGCAIQKALADGLIEKRRLDNYFKIKREAKYDGLSSKEIETSKYERMFKEVGGMKNARRYLKEQKKKKF